MLRSTSRIADLLQQDPPQEARQEIERRGAVSQPRVLLGEGAARLDLAGELGLELRDVPIELRDPGARFGGEFRALRALALEPLLELHELVGDARELDAEERAVQVLREERLDRGRLDVDRRRRVDPESG